LAIIPPADSPFCKEDIANRCIFHLILMSFAFFHKFARTLANSPDCPGFDHEHTNPNIQPVPAPSPLFGPPNSPKPGDNLKKPFDNMSVIIPQRHHRPSQRPGYWHKFFSSCYNKFSY
jgi:hypothetical protein